MHKPLKKDAYVRIVSNSRMAGRTGKIDGIKRKENGKLSPLPYHVTFTDTGPTDEAWFSRTELEEIIPSEDVQKDTRTNNSEFLQKHYQFWRESQNEEHFKLIDEHLKSGKPTHYRSPDKTIEYVVRYENDELAYRTGRPYRITLAFTDFKADETEIIYSAIYETLEELDIYESINVFKLALLKG